MGVVGLEGDRVTHLKEKQGGARSNLRLVRIRSGAADGDAAGTPRKERPAEPRSNLALVGIWMVAPDVVAELRRAPLVSERGEVELSGTLADMHARGRPMGGSVFAGDWL